MMRAFAFGAGAAILYGAWRQPGQVPTPARSFIAFAVLLAMFAAYRAGRRQGRASATAVAVANAQAVSLSEATATGGAAAASVNVFVAPANADLLHVRRFSTAGGVSAPDHLPVELTPLEQHAEIAEDYDPADLADRHERGELVEEGMG